MLGNGVVLNYNVYYYYCLLLLQMRQVLKNGFSMDNYCLMLMNDDVAVLAEPVELKHLKLMMTRALLSTRSSHCFVEYQTHFLILYVSLIIERMMMLT